MEKTRAEVRIVKFSNATRLASVKLDGVIDRYHMVVDDWIEKDYGLVVFATVPNEHLKEVVAELGNIPGVTYSE